MPNSHSKYSSKYKVLSQEVSSKCFKFLANLLIIEVNFSSKFITLNGVNFFINFLQSLPTTEVDPGLGVPDCGTPLSPNYGPFLAQNDGMVNIF